MIISKLTKQNKPIFSFKFQRFIWKNRMFYLVVILCNSCYSPHALHTAKPLNKNQYMLCAGTSVSYQNKDLTFPYPSFHLGGRFAIGKRSDFGISYAMQPLGHYRIDYKHLLIRNKKETFHLSSGIQLDAGFISEYISDFSFSIPVYVSFNDNKRVTPYLVQRIGSSFYGLKTYKYYNSSKFVNEEIGLRTYFYYSGAVGLSIGSTNKKTFFEFSYYMINNPRFASYMKDSGEWINSKRNSTILGAQFSVVKNFTLERKKKNKQKEDIPSQY